MTAKYSDRMMSGRESQTSWANATPQAPFTGVIIHWNAEKGYGFIRRDDKQRDIFVHNLQIIDDVEALSVGTKVGFVPGHSLRSHRPQALDVRVIDGQ